MRTLLTALIVALISTVAVAQTSIGFRGGYGSSNIRTDKELNAISDQFDNSSALSFGVFADIPFGDIISFRPGVELNRRGTTLAITGDQQIFGVNIPIGAQAKTRFTYVDVPLLFQATLPTEGMFKPYAFAGGSLGYATSGNIRTTATAIIEFNLMTTDIDLEAINYERFHAAAIGGLGVKANLAPGFNAFIEGRFEQSLTQPYDVPVVAAQTGFKGINFGAGVAISL
ncbi:MAG: porin family protein [Lewinella sp.]